MDQTEQCTIRLSMFSLAQVFVICLIFTSNVCAQVTIVNMIPASLSNEIHQDSEPNIAVNPSDPRRIAASAFTPGDGFCPENRAPIYISTNNGNSWELICNLPSGATKMTKDITLAFSVAGDTLYAGILRDPSCTYIFMDIPKMNILRTTDFSSATVMEVLAQRCFVDQPYVEALSDEGQDLIYVGSNDIGLIFEGGTRTAVIDQSLDANPSSPAEAVFTRVPIEKRDTFFQDGPPIRTALHPDGTIYSVFFRIKENNEVGTYSSNMIGDITVVRDDNRGSHADPYTDLQEPAPPDGDGLVGVRVVQDITVPWYNHAVFGGERLGPRLSIAVDPRNSSTVYIVWAEGSLSEDEEISQQILHVRKSFDRGRTWTPDLRVINDAINPALAVDNSGRVGFLYQKLRGFGTEHPRWETHLEIYRDPSNFRIRQDIILANVPSDSPPVQFKPYIGDYLDLMAVGRTFYGVFSANNTPDQSHFPGGDIFYQRHADFTTHTLYADEGHETEIQASIDPFFFRVTERFSFDYCITNPALCDFAPEMAEGRLFLQCRKLRDCLVIDHINKNCQVKYESCPGCEPGMLCPPYYHIFLDNLMDAWSVTVVDDDFRAVKHQQFKTKTGVVISFKPDKDKFIDGQIGNFRLVFQMERAGQVGIKYEIKTRIKASNVPFKP